MGLYAKDTKSDHPDVYKNKKETVPTSNQKSMSVVTFSNDLSNEGQKTNHVLNETIRGILEITVEAA